MKDPIKTNDEILIELAKDTFTVLKECSPSQMKDGDYARDLSTIWLNRYKLLRPDEDTTTTDPYQL